MQKKLANKFYLSVEGNTEKWYFDWLAKKINTEPAALNRVTLKCSVEKNPVSYVKSLVPPYGSSISISHICDYEGGNRQQQAQFSSVLTNLKAANTIKPGIKYKLLGYSNLTFELWLILHKQECNGHLSECLT